MRGQWNKCKEHRDAYQRCWTHDEDQQYRNENHRQWHAPDKVTFLHHLKKFLGIDSYQIGNLTRR